MKYHYILKQVRKDEQLGSVMIRSLRDVSLEIEEGSFNFICGPEGSGKSRLLSVLALISMPTSGEFYFRDTNVTKLSEREISAIRAAQIGYLPQIANLNMTSSLLDNISMAAKIRGDDSKKAQEKAMRWIAKTGLSGKELCIPLELDLLDIKRTCIARMMTKSPKILLLDDIYNRLTRDEADELLSLLYKINYEHGTTIIQTARNDNFVKQGTFVYDIHQGATSKRCLAVSAA